MDKSTNIKFPMYYLFIYLLYHLNLIKKILPGSQVYPKHWLCLWELHI